MKTFVDRMVLVAAALSCGAVSAFEFATECAPGHSTHTPSENKYTPAHVRKVTDSCYLGKVNSSHCNAYLWARMPTNFCTSAELVCPIVSGGTFNGANIDIWMLGIENKLGDLVYDQKVWWHTWDDTTSVRMNSYGGYSYLLGNRFPVKIQDNAIESGTRLTSANSPLVFRPEGLMTEIGLMFNRGATTNDFMLMRFNPDALEMTGEIRFSGGMSSLVAESNRLAGAEIYHAHSVRFSAPDNVPVPRPQLSAAEQASETYIRSNVNWVQYRDSDGASGFSYPAYCGVKDGKTRDLYFAIDAPAYTLTNAWLTLNALPPFAGTVPEGAKVSLSLMGFADGPLADTDFVVTDGMFEGQTPIVLQEDVIQGVLYAGKQLLSRRSAQRDLIRALNARVITAMSDVNRGRYDKKAVFRLSVESPAGAADWGFSVGSAATPGVEAFFEGVEYRKTITLAFQNTDFENGLAGWTVSPQGYTANQISVTEDPSGADNHCLRFKGIDTPTEELRLTQWVEDDALARRLRSRPFTLRYRYYLPQKLVWRSDKLTTYGFIYFYSENTSARSLKISSSRWVDHYSAAGKWGQGEHLNVFANEMCRGVKIDLYFHCHEAVDLNMGDECYIDDISVEVEDFYEYPDEMNTLMIIIR